MKKIKTAELMSVAGITRNGDVKTLAMMDCPVFCIQELQGTNPDSGTEFWVVTEGVWFTYDEAKQWADRHKHRLGDEWRIYGVAARGNLKSILNAHTL
jgi:hypothetical protein